MGEVIIMSNMFANYRDNVVGNRHCFKAKPTERAESQSSSQTLITNVKGESIGIQVTYALPCDLYFHLEDIFSIRTEDFEAIVNGTATFEVLTTTHKVVISREALVLDILNKYTNDLCITLSQEEMKQLKRETYTMRLTLKTATMEYPVFAERDGYLVVR
jgi:hypothetical protein